VYACWFFKKIILFCFGFQIFGRISSHPLVDMAQFFIIVSIGLPLSNVGFNGAINEKLSELQQLADDESMHATSLYR
jgi:hypothetical protein